MEKKKYYLIAVFSVVLFLVLLVTGVFESKEVKNSNVGNSEADI
jgi:hypothetical protein